MSQHMEKRI